MKKIISLFCRNYDGDHLVRNEVVPGAEWVIAGEGVATRKRDGTSVLIRGGQMFKRYDAKHGKVPPADFSPAQDPDPITGHWPGWIPIGIGPEDRWHREAFERQDYTFNGEPLIGDIPDGTYELVGPKIGGNKESWPRHALIKHGGEVYYDCPRTFDELKSYLANMNIEGIVWHHPDGRMVKIKRKDFGYKWPAEMEKER